MVPFVHLHVHSEYSLLDGFSNLKKLVKKTAEMGMPAVALTDHGTMFGVVDFFKEAKAANINPVIGLETYVAARRMVDRDPQMDKQSSHLILLAENQAGYLNLLKIASASQLEGFYYHPRIDHEFLEAHSAGLIACSACLAGEIPRAIIRDGVETARQKMSWYFDVFGRDRFFLELQHHNIPELEQANRALLDLGKPFGASYIATNDVHYIERSDYRFQDILLAVQTGSLINDVKRFRMNDDSYYFRSPEEMAALFSEIPEALSNTLLIAQRCQVDLSFSGYHLPEFEVPQGETPQHYLCDLCEEGVRRRYGADADSPLVRERLDYELKVIHDMGFDAYFLIVWDLCRFARELGIWYNARGSAAGSLVAYALEITLVEPIEQGLIFERFLNPGRVSMPDIDLDFQDDKRARIMEYCANRYGIDRVAQIITFGTLGARGAIRDVARVMDIPLSEVDRITKLIPSIPSKPLTIADALEQIPEIKRIYEEAQYLQLLLDTAKEMEGVVRNAGTHAAGVIISDKPLVNYVPLHRPTSGSEETPIKTVCQFEMSVVDYLGLLKVDFLGLSTLTVMAHACDLIDKRHGLLLSLSNIPLDDAETFLFLGQGKTAGVFQLEGAGMTRYLTQMRPRNLANIIAMVALFRPGPMEFIPAYIRRMHGEEEISYRHPGLEPILKETFGIPIYQEQIMFAAMALAGYSAAEADDLRKAISKKNADAIMEHRHKFILGAFGLGIAEQVAGDIFTDWENFARYGFNKSHAADYGIIAVETAFLKAHYTVEYMTALLSGAKNDTSKVAYYAADCRSMEIDVLPPDVNISGWDFTIEDRIDQKPAIRFGLGAIKNVGQGPVDMVLRSRSGGVFKDLKDFARRVDLRQSGKRPLECLIKVGALDSFGPRPALLAALENILSHSTCHFRSLQSGQLSFFGNIAGVEDEIILPKEVHLDQRQQLEWEKELIGLYISDHPLSPYMSIIHQKISHFSGQLSEVKDKEKVRVAGIVTRFRDHLTKTGKMMGFVTLEDIQGSIELLLFPKTWEKFGNLIEPDMVLCAAGRLDAAGKEAKILVDELEIVSLSELPEYDPDLSGAVADERSETQGQEPWEKPPVPREEWSLSDGASVELIYSPVLDQPTIPQANGTMDTLFGQEPWIETPVGSPASDQGSISPIAKDSPIAQDSPISKEPGSMFAFVPQANPQGLSEVGEGNPRVLTVLLNTTGDRDRDIRRMRRVHGLLRSSPGHDRFSFLLVEGFHQYHIDFPNDMIGISTELMHSLLEMVGPDNVWVK